ncbi:MAG TPA: hypothetical protein VHC20_05225 [Candidatus Paceibacterota bacterium]|nr:hypothetical protein [Candidatus Paceibacterota bacterium]
MEMLIFYSPLLLASAIYVVVGRPSWKKKAVWLFDAAVVLLVPIIAVATWLWVDRATVQDLEARQFMAPLTLFYSSVFVVAILGIAALVRWKLFRQQPAHRHEEKRA